MNPLLIGGVEDHVHLLLGLPPVLALSNAVKSIKGRFVETAFTVSKSHLPELTAYIRNQRGHHQRKSFEEEYRAFLDRNEIQHDSRYVFDRELVA